MSVVFITLVKVTATHPQTAETRIVRVGTHSVDRRTAAEDPEERYAADIQGDPTFEWTLFSEGRISGSSVASFGSLRLRNVDKKYDWMREWRGGAWSMEMMMAYGDPRTIALDEFTLQITGACGTVSLDENFVTVPLRDPLSGFEETLQSNEFAGTNSGTTGDESTPDAFKGQLKPFALGRCLMVAPAPSNASAYRYQVHDGTMEDITQSYAGGDVTAFTKDLASGIYTNITGTGFLELTADIRGAKPDGIYRSTPADLIAWLAIERAGLSSANAVEVAALNAAAPYEVGYYASNGESLREVADALAAPRIWYVPDGLGELRMGRLETPSGSPVAEIGPAQVGGVEGKPAVVPLESSEPGGSLPLKKLTLRGVRNWKTLSRDRTASGLDDETRDELGVDYRETVREDPAVKLAYPEAAEGVFTCLLTTLVDLEAEADALWAIRRHPQSFWRVPVETRLYLNVRVGQVVSFSYDRYQLDTPRLYLVLRRKLAGPDMLLDLWRPEVPI
tara:strand:+ start:10017 stop:11534 length:1518 start_codon:yes stop_codon:yes gene_type:complete